MTQTSHTMDQLQAYFEPLARLLRPVTAQFPQPLIELSESLLGPKCTEQLIVNVDPFSSPEAVSCLSLAVSKALSLGIVGLSCIVKLPQITKILSSGSAQGLSLLGFTLEIIAYAISVAYNVRTDQPFTTFGEMVFMGLQNIVIALLIISLERSSGTKKMFVAAHFIGGLTGLVYMLFFDEEYVTMEKLKYLQMASIPIGLASKLPQIFANWRNHSTGQLSAFGVFTALLGSAARVFTTLKEVDDSMLLISVLAGGALNLVLALQMIVYWNSGKTEKRKQKAA